MNQHNDIQYWRKRKAEVERVAKNLALKREKTLYLYEVEKQSRRKTREAQLRTLLEYETRELQQTQAGLQSINSKIKDLEKEQQKHSKVRIIGLLSFIVIMFAFVGTLVYHNSEDALTGGVTAEIGEEAPMVGILPIEETAKESIPEETSKPEVIVPKEKKQNIGVQEIIIQNIPSITLVLNTTNLALNTTDVNLTVYNTTQTNGNSLKVIYNWLRNSTSIALLNMPFEGINGTTTNNAWDYSGYRNNGSDDGAVWNATGGYDSKGSYDFEGTDASFDRIIIPYNESFNLTDTPFTVMAWAKHRTATVNGDSLVCQGSECGTCLGSYNLQITSSSTFQFQTYNTSQSCAVGFTQLNSNTVVSANQWYHVAGVYNGTDLLLYVNGLYETTTAAKKPIVTTRAQIYIGWAHPVFHWNGSIDEVMVFNRSLSASQIYAIWTNQTNIITANETFKNENWTAHATPNNGTGDGIVAISNNLTILNVKPTINTNYLNTTNPARNDSNTNLTIYVTTSDVDGDSIKVIYNWLRNGTSIALLNMPFEKINNTNIENAWDYSGYENNGSDDGAVWNATGGYDSKGSYDFEGTDASFDRIIIPYNESFNLTDTPFTVMAWAKHRTATVNGDSLVCQGSECGTCLGSYNLQITSSSTFQFQTYNTSQSCAVGFTQLNSNTVVSANQWYHVAGVYNGTDLLLYVNGLYETTTAAKKPIVTTRAQIYIGWAHPVFHWNGSIDEVMVFNRSLSASQIYAIWTNQTNIITANETIRGENWTVYATPNDGTDDGTTVRSNNLTIVNIKPAISTIVLNTTNLTTNITTTNLTAYTTSSDGDGDSVKVIYNWLRNSTSIALLNMPFEGINRSTSNNAWDYSGYKNNGSENGGVIWNAIRGYDSKGAYVFDGDNDYILVAHNETLNTSGPLTVAFWFNTPGLVGNDGAMASKSADSSKYFGVASTTAWELGVLDGLIYWQISNGITKDQLSGAFGAYNDSKWHFLAAQWSGTTITNGMKIYMDGAVLYQGTATITAMQGLTSVLDIGGYTTTFNFNGTIDEVMIFNRSLSAEQIFALWKNQTNIITTNETIRGENWTVHATPNDGTDDGTTVRSNNLTIVNTAPTSPVLWNLTNRSIVTTRTPTFVWNVSSDADGEAVTYRIQIDDNILFNNLEVNVGGITNTTFNNVTYTLITELSVDTSYFWRVLANDSLNDGSISETRNFTVQSYLAVNVTAEAAAFGTLPTGANVSTPNNASSLRAENIGNIIANVTVTGTNLFNFNSFPSSFYRFKIRANESGAFNTTASATEWNQTNTTLNANIFHVINLDWHDVSNDFLTDLNISVPLNESAGSKISTITFTITG